MIFVKASRRGRSIVKAYARANAATGIKKSVISQAEKIRRAKAAGDRARKIQAYRKVILSRREP